MQSTNARQYVFRACKTIGQNLILTIICLLPTVAIGQNNGIDLAKMVSAMRFLLIGLTFLTFCPVWSQPSDDYVTAIEKLRSEGKLTTRSSTNRTFAGSVTGYYDNDSLVLINILTDTEEAGTETIYFI
ncbi:MAG TPA: hypothetical protein VD884_11130 [Ohtaekwangia sp.]|nr:hypothetical protein [Ohtaekwangia sp.]